MAPVPPSDENPFGGRFAVKIVGITDILLAASLLGYYGYKWAVFDARAEVQPLGKGPITIESVIRSQVFGIWISVMVLHSLQFLLSFVLLSSTYDRDAEDALGKCQLWWYGAMTLFWGLLVEALGMGYMMLATTGIQPVAMTVFIVKLVYRLTAVVNVRNFMNNLKKAPPTSVHSVVYIRSKKIGPPPSNYIKY